MKSARRREGEFVAMAFNQKEQRLLQKTVGTIRMEASYSLKLLQLDNRNLKVYFRQLRDRVSRLKSHLTVEEIQHLRQLEADGQLQPLHPSVNLGSALKIAATHRRLNSAHLRHPSTTPRQSDVPSPPCAAQTPQSAPGAPVTQRLKRSNSVAGAFVDAPAPATQPDKRPQSASVALDRRTDTLSSMVGDKTRSKEGGTSEVITPTAAFSDSRGPKAQEEKAEERPDSRGCKKSPDQREDSQKTPTLPGVEQSNPESQQLQRPPDTDPQSSQKAASQRGVSRGASSLPARIPFSSHSAAEKSQNEAEMKRHGAPAAATPRSRYSSLDKDSTFLGLLQDDSMDDLDQDLYEERRAELLEEEQLRAASLTKRKDKFVKDLDKYLRDHPPPTIRPRLHTTRKTCSLKKKETAEEEQELAEAMLRRRRVEFDFNPTHLPEADYSARLRGLWKDMNRCRYLRVSDDQLDLSAVNTLATDTLKLYKVLKRQERKPSCSAKSSAKEM